ncbi:MAG TPA: histidinol dehydrogenase [Polyangiaceae bacterium]|nr:histidinol dehydrogenase [Polyangiaceae bacterium]
MSPRAELTTLRDGSDAFVATLKQLEQRGEGDLSRVEPRVRAILDSVRAQGDDALRQWVQELESRTLGQIIERNYGGKAALDGLSQDVRGAMEHAAKRISNYHERQMRDLVGFDLEAEGVRLTSRVTPLARVGVYAPGGKARYPSSVLMSALIARVAGVNEIIVATPDASAEVRAACHLSGVSAIVNAGGAQAIAALAYGTASVPRVDKIVGPGNIYVAAAKRLVFGQVDIDSIAGPSEILVVADASADPELLAADLLSQAEHDEAAYPLLLSSEASHVQSVQRALDAQLEGLPRNAIARASLTNNGFLLLVENRDRLVEIANMLAAEHVALHVDRPRDMANAILRAGALFIGPQTREAAGDYLAGPSHVLPTGGAARYAAPLGVYDFVSRSSLIEYSRSALQAHGPDIANFARAEGLEAHARAVTRRTSHTE